MNRENAVQYFSRKTSFMIWLVGIVGLCMIYVGYAGERRSVIFMVIGVVLIGLCVYEAVSSKKRMRKGTELDAMAEEELKKRALVDSALTKLCLGREDIEGLERIQLKGYCAFPIQTRPYFRRDEMDGKLRTSNYQTALFIFREDRFYAYSYVIFLVDKEKSETGRMWRYCDIKEARIVSEEMTYLIGTGDEKRETASIEYLTMTDSEGRRFSFFYGEGEEGGEAAARIVALINEGQSTAPKGLDMPEEESSDFEVGAKRREPSAARGRDLDIGIIGTELKMPAK